MKKFVKFLIALVLLLFISYLVFLNIPKAKIKNKEAITSLDASTLFNEFNNNENLASKKYIGKILEVNGTIKKKMEDKQQAPVIILGTANENQILITLESNQSKKLSNYKLGDSINLKAQCSGMLMEVVMNKAIIIE